jgi:hypothetical protein
MIGSLIVTTWLCATLGAAQPPPQLTPSPLTSEGIIAAIGTESDAREVVKLILGKHFEQRNERREFVLASQIRETWLPALTRTSIVRLADADVDRHLATCGRYWVVSDVTRRDNVVSMKVGERCGCSFRDYVATFENHEWHLGPPRATTGGGSWAEGIGSGCVGPPPGCPCFGR